jgi:transposase-like protein
MEAIREMLEQESGQSGSPEEGARRASGAGDRQPFEAPPDPEVPDKPVRRKFTADYKMRILEEADRCKEPGEIGALLRREGLYSSHLSTWRRNRREGTLGALAPKKRGPAPDPTVPFKKRIGELEREVSSLRKELAQAMTIIDVQKKVSGLLQATEKTDEESS